LCCHVHSDVHVCSVMFVLFEWQVRRFRIFIKIVIIILLLLIIIVTILILVNTITITIIIIIDNFCIALFSGVPKLTALYNIL